MSKSSTMEPTDEQRQQEWIKEQLAKAPVRSQVAQERTARKLARIEEDQRKAPSR